MKDGNLKSMGVKNVVNIPTDHVETALSLSAETFKVIKCSKSRPFTAIDYMIYVTINNSTLGNLWHHYVPKGSKSDCSL